MSSSCRDANSSTSWCEPRRGKAPWQLDIADLDAPLIGAFLDDLETGRGNSARTRNNRLAAIRSMFAWAALRHPEHADTIARVLAITPKRSARQASRCSRPAPAGH